MFPIRTILVSLLAAWACFGQVNTYPNNAATINGLVPPRLLSVTLNAAETTDKLSCVSNAGVEQVFATTYAIPANYLNAAGKGLRFEYILQVTSSGTADTLLAKVRVQKSGPTNVYFYTQAAAISPGNSATSSPFNAAYELWASGAAASSASVYAGGSFSLLSGPFVARSTNANPITMDTTVQQTVQATLTCTLGTAANSVSIMGLKVWALN